MKAHESDPKKRATQSFSDKPHFLCAVNFRLPDSDYRLCYSLESDSVSVAFALPEKPEGIPLSKFYQLEIGEGIRPAYLISLAKFGAYLIKSRNELTGIHFYSSLLFTLGPILARIAQIPCIITVTGFGRVLSDPRLRALTPLYWLLLKHAMRYSRAVLFQNSHDLEYVAKKYPSYRPKLYLIGSSTRFPNHSHKRSFDDTVLRVLLVSRLAPDKGIEDFLFVARSLANPTLQFSLVGSGSNQALQNAVNEAKLAGTINYRGRLVGSALEEVFAHHHFFLFPSKAEGMSRVMIEAGLSGLCPVAYDIPANRDIIPVPDKYLVPCFNLDALTAKLKSLVDNRPVAAQSAEMFQQHVKENFAMEAFVHRMDKLLVDLGFATKTT
jgi:glycosyltransferase involved in cell wall biosynthesis